MSKSRYYGKRECLKMLSVASDGAEVTCDGRLFQRVAPEIGKVCLPMVEIERGTLSTLSGFLQQLFTCRMPFQVSCCLTCGVKALNKLGKDSRY